MHAFLSYLFLTFMLNVITIYDMSLCKIWSFVYAVFVCTVGPNEVVIKLVDRETLMKEREERLKVFLS